MAKVNFVVTVDDQDVFDDAAIQIIKNKVRSAVDSQVDKRFDEIIEKTIDSKIRSVTDAIRVNGPYYWDKETKDRVRKAIIEKAAEVSVNDDLIRKCIDEYMSESKNYLNHQQAMLRQRIDDLGEDLEKRMKERTIKLLNSAIVTALQEVICKGDSNENEG